MALHRKVDKPDDPDVDINPIYVQEAGHEVPMHTMPCRGMLPSTALQVVRDELTLDGNPRLNLATFVTTWMEPQAEVLITECLGKNMIDKDEYPQTAELESRCVSILANLWHARSGSEATGCSTTGSSEACMLGGMALLWRWLARGRTGQPNLVMGANVQVCWDKFCRYWRIEPRKVPLEPGRLHLTGPEAVARCDENTIGVVAILGSTLDGSYEPVAGISHELDNLAAGGGPDVPIHVDAASGGTSRCTYRPRSPGWGRSSCSPTAASCPCSPSSWPATRPATACSTCQSGCARAAGWCPPTPSRTT
jgi:glutamate decarboxylase